MYRIYKNIVIIRNYVYGIYKMYGIIYKRNKYTELKCTEFIIIWNCIYGIYTEFVYI